MGLTVSVCVCGGEDTELGKRRTQQLHVNLDLQAVFYPNEESKQITKKSKGQQEMGRAGNVAKSIVYATELHVPGLHEACEENAYPYL